MTIRSITTIGPTSRVFGTRGTSSPTIPITWPDQHSLKGLLWWGRERIRGSDRSCVAAEPLAQVPRKSTLLATVEDNYVESTGTSHWHEAFPFGCSRLSGRGLCPRCNCRSQVGWSSCEPDRCRLVRRSQTNPCS